MVNNVVGDVFDFGTKFILNVIASTGSFSLYGFYFRLIWREECLLSPRL